MILLLYHLCIFIVGFWISGVFVSPKKFLLRVIVAISLGLLVSLPLTYLFAVALQHTSDPLYFGVVLFMVGSVLFLWWRKKEWVKKIPHSLSVVDIFISFLSIMVSWYLMTKTFKEGNDGMLLIARNVLFDFGHGLSITRSLSLGSNIPYTSPFVAGTDQLYHFMFQFWTAILEHFGCSLTAAINLPSIIGFTLLLLTVYCLGKEWFGKTIVGIAAVLFTLFQSTLMFIPFFQKYGISLGAILHNPNYFAAGPFDGSIISLFMTLNVFVNQRHLGIAMALFFLIYFLFQQDLEQKRLTISRTICYGILVGFLTLWHLILALGLLLTVGFLLVWSKKWKEVLLFTIVSLSVALVFIMPWIPYLIRGITAILAGVHGVSSGEAPVHHSTLGVFSVFIQNFGFALFFFIIGLFVSRSTVKKVFPLFILTSASLLLSIPTGILDQKYLSIFLILFKLFCASGVLIVWKWNAFGKVLVISLFPFLILSGLIDFMVIKNDYLFPVPDRGASSLMTWIEDKTPKNTVFLSYPDIFDSVTLSGRKNYLGFFRQPDIFLTDIDKKRPSTVRDIYTATTSATVSQGLSKAPMIDYLIIPLWDKPDFTYHVDQSFFRKTFPIAYEDRKNLVLKLR